MSQSSEQQVASSEPSDSSTAVVAITGLTGIGLLSGGLLCVAGAVWGLLGFGCVMTALGVTAIVTALVRAKQRGL